MTDSDESFSDKLSEFVLPDIWNNEDEIYRLFQRIKRPRHIDPLNFERTYSFWRTIILRYAKINRVFVFTPASLTKVFSRYFPEEEITLSPECLPQVLGLMYQNGDIVPNSSEASLFKRIAIFGINLITEKFDVSCINEIDPITQFVIPEIANSLVSHFVPWFNKAYTTYKLSSNLSLFFVKDLDNSLESCFPHKTSRDFIKHLLFNVYKCARIERVKSKFCSSTFELVRLSNCLSIEVSEALSEDERMLLSGLALIRQLTERLQADEERLVLRTSERRQEIKQLLNQKK
ncbi:unnamed protein product [Protopolystoma xenopodis]|uniref:Uncharacterized protein n=1 Tax=Protopolystoma xenopodis TaxID=117903 RepID=A0A3S5B166_9PLAT|nr:unnamed protein product [Protopolystoma xenopodis]